MSIPEIQTLAVTRYLVPLREGGSLPAIIEAEDDLLYVMKFRGAGQGAKALIAELIGGDLATLIGLNVPQIVLLTLDDTFSKTEPDEEIQDLLKFSVGLNLGMTFLSQAMTYDPVVSVADSLTASKVVMLDSLITNIDRTARNTNLLNWREELWVIDHGASLYFHHGMKNWEEHAHRTFPAIKDHVLLERASLLEKAAEDIQGRISPQHLEEIVALIPEDWLIDEQQEYTIAERREIYVAFLTIRLQQMDILLNEAIDARKARI